MLYDVDMNSILKYCPWCDKEQDHSPIVECLVHDLWIPPESGDERVYLPYWEAEFLRLNKCLNIPYKIIVKRQEPVKINDDYNYFLDRGVRVTDQNGDWWKLDIEFDGRHKFKDQKEIDRKERRDAFLSDKGYHVYHLTQPKNVDDYKYRARCFAFNLMKACMRLDDLAWATDPFVLEHQLEKDRSVTGRLWRSEDDRLSTS